MNTQMTRQYKEFRQHLSSRQLDNFRATLKNRAHDGELPQGLSIIELGSSVRYHIYVDKAQELVWLLGGHWIRPGEESQQAVYRLEMEGLVRRIGRGGSAE